MPFSWASSSSWAGIDVNTTLLLSPPVPSSLIKRERELNQSAPNSNPQASEKDFKAMED